MSPGTAFSFDGAAEIVAHRGFSARAPENTIAALELAIDTLADAVEFDLHTASDGTPVLLHDVTVDRTTSGTGAVASLSVDALSRLDAGSWFDTSFAGEPVPTLSAALEAVGGRIDRIYAEVKGTRRPEDVRAVVDAVRSAGLEERVVYISMDWSALDRIRAYDGRALIGYIVEERSRAAGALERASSDARALLDFDARILLSDPTLAERAGAVDIALATWTVDTADAASRLLAMGVPRITTNRVDTLRAWKESL